MAKQSYLFITNIAKNNCFCSFDTNNCCSLDYIIVEAYNIKNALCEYHKELWSEHKIRLDESSFCYPLLAKRMTADAPEGVFVLYGKKTVEDEVGNTFEGGITLAVTVAKINFIGNNEIKQQLSLSDRLKDIRDARYDEYYECPSGGPMFAPLNGAEITGYALPCEEEVGESDFYSPIAFHINNEWVTLQYDKEGATYRFRKYITKKTLDESFWNIKQIDGYIAAKADKGEVNICDPIHGLHIIIKQEIKSEWGPISFVFQD